MTTPTAYFLLLLVCDLRAGACRWSDARIAPFQTIEECLDEGAVMATSDAPPLLYTCKKRRLER